MAHGVQQFVSLLMIAEIVSNGMLSLPNAMAAVGKRATVRRQCQLAG